MKKLLLLLIYFSCLSASDLAYEAYTQGELAKTSALREKYFNEALKLYSEHEDESAKLYFNKGNCYYQLGQMGMAIWHYKKALLLSPRDTKIRDNLTKAYQSAGIETSSMKKVISQLFFFHTKMTMKERIMGIYIFAAIAFVLLSAAIWFKRGLFISLGFSIFACACLLGASHALHKTQNKHFGIVITPVQMRCDAGEHYQSVCDNIELSGSQVIIRGFSEDGAWLRIKTSQGQEGYVPKEKIRLI